MLKQKTAMRRNRAWALCAILGTLSSSVSQAAGFNSCPLSNPVYRDVRLAAAALEKKINLPPDCTEISQRLQQLGGGVNTAVTQLAALKEQQEAAELAAAGKPVPVSGVGAQQVAIAVSGVMEINKVLATYSGNDRCSKALMTRLDYVEALVDTVNGLSPYMIAFGGVGTPVTMLGASIIGSVVKTFISLFQNTRFDMTKSEQRQTFIENSCGFYQYNENLRSLIQARQGAFTDTDRLVERLDSELTDFEKIAPPTPTPSKEIMAMDIAFKKDLAKLTEFSGIIARMSEADSFVCYIARSQAEKSLAKGEFPAPAVERLRHLLDDSDQQAYDTSAKRALIDFFGELNRPELYQPELMPTTGRVDPIKACATRAKQWLSMVREILVATDIELARGGRRDLRESEEYKTRKAWEEALTKKRVAVLEAKRLQKYVHDLAGRGEEVEVSELLDIRDSIQTALFADDSRRVLITRVHMKSPAEAWLEYKWRQSGEKLKDFSHMMQRIRVAWLDRSGSRLPPEERGPACAYVENAAITWLTAQRHMQASTLFCETFGQTINDASFPTVAQYCIGRFDKSGHQLSEGTISKRSTEVAVQGSDAARLFTWLKDAGCSAPAPAEELLN